MMFLAEVFVEMIRSRQEPTVGLPDIPTLDCDSLTLKAIVLLRELLLNKKQSWELQHITICGGRNKKTVLKSTHAATAGKSK